MADEAFESLWSTRGGPDFVAMQGMFGGSTVPADEIRDLLGLSHDEMRATVIAAQRVGLVEHPGDRITFLAFAPGSAQQGRLEWCLESHQAEHDARTRRLRTVMLVRYLSMPPGLPA